MELKKTTWKYLKPSPVIMMMFGVFAVISMFALVSNYREGDKFEANIKYEMSESRKKRIIESIPEEVRTGEYDKNVRYSDRIREASSVGLGLSMFVISQRVSKGRVMALSDVMTEFSASELLPPGVTVLLTQKELSFGVVQTQRGIYLIRYSSRPLKLEILATTIRGFEDGAVFILRIPDTSASNKKVSGKSSKVKTAGAWATLFEAPENVKHSIPPAFSNVSTFEQLNWKVSPLQQTELSPERIKQLNEFVANETK